MNNLYVKTLERMYKPLIDIANSDRLANNEQAQFEIMQAYELLDKATTRLIIRGCYGSK
ncbi:serine/threonine protein kinase [Leuconostoc mesenteroides]|uniref:serine/threonine protein kinase n=2 Tax=Lactobacillaceae TaxID=33958 RepID=UPI0020732684|nr:serine/threonine protein kinase [Leuconostoc mesenteroides]MCM6834367.1 serine/threonine protein kinase [Leuconostoc mesenteroides]